MQRFLQASPKNKIQQVLRISFPYVFVFLLLNISEHLRGLIEQQTTASFFINPV